jgi:hypothetical protein
MSAQAQTTAPALRESGRSGRQLVDTLIRAREASLVGVLALVVLGTTAVNSRFLNAQNVRDILLNVAIVALLAIGQTVVVVTRNIDLSVGSVLGISAFLTGVLFADHHVVIPVAFAAGILLGAFFGLLNGAMVSLARVPSLVITLGTLYVIRGVDFVWAKGRQINAAQMPDSFLKLGGDTVLGIPVLALITLAVLIVVGYVMSRTRMGRELYAIGSNPEAATLVGIRVSRRDRRERRHRPGARGRGGRRGRRRRDLRRLGQRLRRRARCPAAGLHRVGARRAEGRPVLGAGDRRPPAARRHRTRPAARAARGRRADQEEWTAPCRVTCAPASGAGRR